MKLYGSCERPLNLPGSRQQIDVEVLDVLTGVQPRSSSRKTRHTPGTCSETVSKLRADGCVSLGLCRIPGPLPNKIGPKEARNTRTPTATARSAGGIRMVTGREREAGLGSLCASCSNWKHLAQRVASLCMMLVLYNLPCPYFHPHRVDHCDG